MRTSLRLAVVAAWLAVLAGSGAEAADARGPNVLMIIVDDLGNTLGCYGDPRVKSPNIDALAARGLRFDRAYCQYPVCNPSRTSLLTGLRPDSTRVLDNTVSFRKALPDVVTLPQLLRQAGYFTARVGKVYHDGAAMDDAKSWDRALYPEGTSRGRGGEGRNLTDGRLRWCAWRAAEGDDDDQPDGHAALEAIRILEENGGQPFFLALGFHKPHDPFVAPRKYFDLYPPDALRLPEAPPGRSPDPPLALPKPMKDEFDRFTDRERREFLRAYLAGISFTDTQVGRVLEALDRLGLREKTVVMLLGDHGYHLGERGWWNKNTLFELSARAPLIVDAPGMKAAGRACARLVEFVDLYPTLADLCGLTPPAGLEGRSLRPLLDDPGQPWKDAAFTQVRRGTAAGYSVRTDRWRYTEWDGGRQGAELYDHEKDPGEWHNLAADPGQAEVVARLRRSLDEARRAASPAP